MEKDFFQVPYLPLEGRDLLPLEHENFDTLEEAEAFARENGAAWIYHYGEKFKEVIRFEQNQMGR